MRALGCFLAILGACAANAAADPQSALMEAVVTGDVPAARRAIDSGADVNLPSAKSEGHTPLEMALDDKHRERSATMVGFLLKQGADPNLADADGNTPLIFVAVDKLDVSFARMLINPGGAGLGFMNNAGKTALDIARENGEQELADYLASDEASNDEKEGAKDREKRPVAVSSSVRTDLIYDLGKPLNRGPLVPVGTGSSTGTPAKPKPFDPDAVLFPESPPADKPYFRGLRIDPQALTNVVGSPAGRTGLGVSAAELNELVGAWRKLGVKTIYVAHTERDNHFYYKPKRAYTYRVVPEGSKLTPSKDPKLYLGALTDGTDFLTVLFNAASRNNMKVILGLSPPGDHTLLANLDRAAQRRKPGEPDDGLLSPDIDKAVQASFEEAQDLFAQFRTIDSFGGWHLGPPMLCADEAMRFAAPLGRRLRKLAPGKTVALSLFADAKACSGKTDLARVLKSAEDAVDTVLYQDGLGTGRYAETTDGIAQILDHFGAADCGGHDCRDERLRQLEQLLPALGRAHAGTKVAFGILAEGWRRPGKCPAGSDAGYPEDCPQKSLPPSWNKELRGQLEKEARLVPAPGSLVLADGLSIFDFRQKHASSRDFDVKVLGARLTRDYLSYLGAPKPQPPPAPVTTATATSTATAAVSAIQDMTKMEESQVLCSAGGSLNIPGKPRKVIPSTGITITVPLGQSPGQYGESRCADHARGMADQACADEAGADSYIFFYEWQLIRKDGSTGRNTTDLSGPCRR